MKRTHLKRVVTAILQEKDLRTVLIRLNDLAPSDAVNPLFSCLCHPDEFVRWHAVSGFGLIVGKIAKGNIELARIVMRRCLWMLNDESGGIGWGVPEAMAESMIANRQLAEEYLHMLVSYTLDDGPELFQNGNFLEIPALQQGVLWGLWRLAPKYRQPLIAAGIANNLCCYFTSGNSQVRGLVCSLCSAARLTGFTEQIKKLAGDDGLVRIYYEGAFINDRVGGLAQAALAELRKYSI